MLDVAAHHRVLGGRAEDRLAGEEFVGDAADRVQVGLVGDRAGLRLLGCHVGGSAHDHAGCGQARRAGFLDCGHAEVQDEDRALRGDHDVVGLKVAVHQAGVMGHRERRAYLGADRRGGRGRQRDAVLQESSQGGAVDQLHCQVGQPGLLARPEVVDNRNTGVAELRGDPALTHEAF